MRFRKRKKPNIRTSRARYRFCMEVITSNFESADEELDTDPVYVLFDAWFSSERTARDRAMKLYEKKTAIGVLPAEFHLYRVDSGDKLTPIGLLTPRVVRTPFKCVWEQPRVEMIRGAA